MIGPIEKFRYERILNELNEIEKKYQASQLSGDPFPEELENKQSRLAIRLVEEFPDRKDLLLPTPFGNALRAFESFPRVMYGLDSIPAWGRLLAVTPKEFIELMDGAKSYVDLWVNLGFVLIILLIEYVGLVFARGYSLNWWIIGLWMVVATLAPLRATSSAMEWGHLVKSAFDIFRPNLRQALRLEEPKNREEEFAQWQEVSRALIYRLPDHLPELKSQEPPRKESFLEFQGWPIFRAP